MGEGLVKSIKDEVRPIVEGMGFKIVELKLGISHKLMHITIVIYSKNGIGIDACSKISKNIHHRLELIEGIGNLMLEVTSPGIDRKIKSWEEYDIFKGRGIRILLENESEWLKGVIEGTKERELIFKYKEGIINIDMNKIKKANLDYIQENKNVF